MKAGICISFNNCKQFAKDVEGPKIGGDLCDLLITSYDSFGIHILLTTTLPFNDELEAWGWAADYAELTLWAAYKSLFPHASMPMMDSSTLYVELENEG